MERKLIRQGGGGYTVYLPKRWVDKKGLDAGSQVQILETETSLVITSSVLQKRAIAVPVTPHNKEDITNILTHLYRRGLDAITITGADPGVAKKVDTTTQDLLLGFEVTEREGGKIRLENLSEPSEQKYDVLLKRIFLIIKETHRTVAAELQSGKYSDEVKKLRLQQDKYILFCRRSLVKEKEARSISTAWELLTFLMHIEHAYFYVHKYAGEHKVKTTPRIAHLLGDAQELFDLYHDAFYKKDLSCIHEINRRRDDVFERCYKYLTQAKGHEIVVLSHLRELLRLIQIGSSPILSELLQDELHQ